MWHTFCKGAFFAGVIITTVYLIIQIPAAYPMAIWTGFLGMGALITRE